MNEEPVWFTLQKKFGRIPTYFKYVLKCCGYENPYAIATICEEDISYFEEEVRSGAISTYFKSENLDIFEGSTKPEESFEFSRDHKKLLLEITNFVKINLETHGVDFFSQVQHPKLTEPQELEIFSKAVAPCSQTVTKSSLMEAQYNSEAVSMSVKAKNNEEIVDMHRIEFCSHTEAPEPTELDTFSKAASSQSKSLCNSDADSISMKVTASSSSESSSQFVSNLESVPTTKEIKLIQIDCSESATKNYYDEEGYVYTRNNSKTTKSMYFRCKNKNLYKCHAKVIAKGNNLEKAVLKVGHVHTPEKKIIDRTIFSKTLDKVVIANPLLARRKAFFKAKTETKKTQVDRVNILELKSYENFIHKRQKRVIPLLANSISTFETLINSEQYKQRYCYDERDLIFYRGVWKDKNGNSSIVFMSETGLQLLAKLENITLLMDGTFKVLCYHLKFCQLYIISFIYKNRCYPLAFILMEKRDFLSYDAIFTNIKLLIPSMNVSNCMSDYELATRKALRAHFPNSRISGCYFHYVQATMKSGKRFGLLKDEDLYKAIQQVCALALLPNEFILEGFQTIDRNVKKSSRWDRFKTYWLKQWLNANISVYGLANRSNNFGETLNKMINSLIEHAHPNIWVLINNLKSIEMDKTDELERNEAGDMIITRRNKEMVRLNKKILQATKIFDEDQDVEAFLKHITFNDKLELFFKERIYLEEIDKKYEFDEGDLEDDAIIPNDFNEESNFRYNHPRLAATSKRNTDTCSSNKRQKH